MSAPKNNLQVAQTVTAALPPQVRDFFTQMFSDKRGLIAESPLLNVTYLLDAARAMEQLDGIDADFVYADSDSNGKLYMKFNNINAPWIPFTANQLFSGIPIKRAWVKNTAQAGLSVNLVWGYGARILPPNFQTVVTGTLGTLLQQLIGGSNTLITSDRGIKYGATFDSSANLGINGSETVLAAGSNPNGVMLWDCDVFTQATTGGTVVVSAVTHTVAPTVFADGHKQFIIGDGVATAAGDTGKSGSMPKSKEIASGRGLFFFNSGSVAEGASRRKKHYTIL